MCGQCEKPIHHSEERDFEISCWDRHWKTHCSRSENPITQFPAA
jgi:hypothetical protein